MQPEAELEVSTLKPETSTPMLARTSLAAGELKSPRGWHAGGVRTGAVDWTAEARSCMGFWTSSKESVDCAGSLHSEMRF